MTRAARPQTGRIRHQNDCLVKTSNFSSLSARGLELRSRSAPRPPPDSLATRCWVSGLWGQPQRKGPEAGIPDAPLRCTIAPGKPWGETDRALSWGAPDRLVAKKISPGTISVRRGPCFPGHHGNAGVPWDARNSGTSAGVSCFPGEFRGLQGSTSAPRSGLSRVSCVGSTRQGLTNYPLLETEEKIEK